MTQSVEISGSDWVNVSDALSLADGEYVVQNIGPTIVEIFNSATEPAADVHCLKMPVLHFWQYEQVASVNMWARVRNAPGSSVLVFDS